MNKAFEKIWERLEELKLPFPDKCPSYYGDTNTLIDQVKQVVQEIAKEYNNGWIPCSERLPAVETEVLIVAKRKWKDGTCKYITTTAIYEDGAMLENNSCWWWEGIEGEWNEEEDCYIIPQGWWEIKHYNGDGEQNHAVDDEVIAWQPLPEPYKECE